MSNKQQLREVAATFLKLGCIAFGGPAAHIALMEQEVVEKKKWMSREHFIDLIGVTNLIPGPNSTEMTMHCGYERAGRAGLFIAGACFILPAVIITAVFAWLYQTYRQLPQVHWMLTGITPVILAIIVKSAYQLARQAVKNTIHFFLLITTLLVCFLGVNEIVVLLGAGILYAFPAAFKKKKKLYSLLPFYILQNLLAPFYLAAPFKLFFIFLKIGALLYGSGYVLFAFLKSELVDTGMMTEQQLVDAVAVGHFTPGPLFSTATFIGWQLDGPGGAALATAGIFAPSFFFVWIVNPFIPRLRASKIMSLFLDGVNVAAVGLIGYVSITIGQNVVQNWLMVVLFAASLFALIRYSKVNSAFLIIIGGIIGYLLNIFM